MKARKSCIPLDAGDGLAWVVNFTPQPLYPRVKNPRQPLDRLCGPQIWSGRSGVEKNLSESGTGPPACSLSLYRLRCRSSWDTIVNLNACVYSTVAYEIAIKWQTHLLELSCWWGNLGHLFHIFWQLRFLSVKIPQCGLSKILFQKNKIRYKFLGITWHYYETKVAMSSASKICPHV
jgi:hypothetical protein